MKTLKFRHNLAEEILSGTKTVTWRLFDDKDLMVGDRLELLNWESKERFAVAEITAVREKPLSNLAAEDFIGHGKYESGDELIKHFQEYYGSRVTPDTPVKIIGFKIL